MSVRVIVGDYKTLEEALREFRKRVQIVRKLGWAKRKPGYFEKPCVTPEAKGVLQD
jgi:ribosomal protein S21